MRWSLLPVLLLPPLAGLVGCGTTGYYRYAAMYETPEAARAVLRERAVAAGMTPVEDATRPDADYYRALVASGEADAETYGIAILPKYEQAPVAPATTTTTTPEVATETPPPTETPPSTETTAGTTETPATPAPPPPPPPPPRRRQLGMRVRAFPDGDGSLVEIAAPLARLIDAVQPDGRTYHAVDGFVWSDRVPWELAVEPGLASYPGGAPPAWRVDTMVRVGGRLLTRGGGRWNAAPRFGLSLLTGVGLAIAETHPASRVELTLSADLQSTVTPLDVVIPRGRRYALDLSVAALMPLDDGDGGVEASLALHISPWGGVFARAGYQGGDEPGTTWMAGLKLDTVPTLYLVAAAAMGAMIYGLATADYETCGGVHTAPC